MRIESHAESHIGRRSNNEDAHLLLPRLGLFAVADGMGGYEGGEVASHLAMDTLAAFFQRQAGDEEATWPFRAERTLSFDENLLRVGAMLAHETISSQRSGRLAQMGSTLAALVLRGERAIIGHVGDSRVYRLRGQALTQLTRDHSLYAELLAQGADLPPKERCPFAHVITRALGLSEDCGPELSTARIEPGDVFLLCTDGLSEPVGEERIAALLRLPPEDAAAALVRAAYDAGGKDNITALVVRVS